MKENLRDIRSGIGLGKLMFGLNKQQVREIMGKPNEIEMNSYSDAENDKYENWHYDDFELSVSFSEEDSWKLDTIAVNSSYYKLSNKSLIGKSINEIKEQLNKWKILDTEFENWSNVESPDHKLLSSDSLGINFWFDDGILTEIQWGPLFKNEETIIWPNANPK